MEILQGILNAVLKIFDNYAFIAAGSSWLIAQVVKTVIHVIVNGEFKAERLVGAGGMPSCHSATVCALTTAMGIQAGIDSPVFALTAIFAVVVMYDAVGVRRETGIQAEVINEMMDFFREMGKNGMKMSAHEALKEFVGHTPMQVAVGAMMGIIIAIAEGIALYGILQ